MYKSTTLAVVITRTYHNTPKYTACRQGRDTFSMFLKVMKLIGSYRKKFIAKDSDILPFAKHKCHDSRSHPLDKFTRISRNGGQMKATTKMYQQYIQKSDFGGKRSPIHLVVTSSRENFSHRAIHQIS